MPCLRGSEDDVLGPTPILQIVEALAPVLRGEERFTESLRTLVLVPGDVLIVRTPLPSWAHTGSGLRGAWRVARWYRRFEPLVRTAVSRACAAAGSPC